MKLDPSATELHARFILALQREIERRYWDRAWKDFADQLRNPPAKRRAHKSQPSKKG
jgi:hypothetical protein